ncbi:MAG: hypothetical protein KGL16_04805 [Acidobacteriota bacterium]|nr:hypothetical protein [Acidobacteriota bacterium]
MLPSPDLGAGAGLGVVDLVTAGSGMWFPEAGDRLAWLSYRGVFGSTPVGAAIDAIAVDSRSQSVWFTSPNGFGCVVGRVTGNASAKLTPLPNGDCPTAAITAAPDGSVWVSGDCFGCSEPNAAVYRLDASGTVTSFDFQGGAVDSLGLSSDGSLWGAGGGSLLRFTPPSGKTVAYDTCFTEWLAADSAGAWFDCGNYASFPGGAGELGVASQSGTLTTFTLPTPSPLICGLALGPLAVSPSGVWFAGGCNNLVELTGAGLLTAYAAPGCCGSVAVGWDGGIWYTEPGRNAIGRLDPWSAPTACARALGVNSRLREVVSPGPDLKSTLSVVSSVLDNGSLLGTLGKYALVLTPIGDEYIAFELADTLVSAAESGSSWAVTLDPPDPHFTGPTSVRPMRVPHLHADRQMSAAAAATYNALLRNGSLVAALQTSYLAAVEKAKGAALQHNDAWLIRQDHAAAGYAARLATAYKAQAPLVARADRLLRHSPLARIRITAGTITRARRALAHGLPPAIVAVLRSSGLNTAGVRSLARQLQSLKLKPGTLASLAADPTQTAALKAGATAYATAADRARCLASG